MSDMHVKLLRQAVVERYFPSVIANAFEFKELAKVENAELMLVWAVAVKWFLNTHVYEIDLDGASRWEQMLSIIPPADAGLDERRAAILAKLNTSLPYTIRRLQQILDACYGANYAVATTTNKYELIVTIDNKAIFFVNSMRPLLKCIVPANLIIKIVQPESCKCYLYRGGIASTFSKVNVPAPKDFSVDNIPTAYQYFGGSVGSTKMIEVWNEVKIEFAMEDEPDLNIILAGKISIARQYYIKTEAV